MVLNQRSQLINLFGNEFLLTPRSKQKSDELERKYHMAEYSIRIGNIKDTLKNSKLPEEESKKLLAEMKTLEELITKCVSDVNDETIMGYIKDTPNCPSLEDIKSDELLYTKLLQAVILFMNGNEHYENKMIDVLKRNILQMPENSTLTIHELNEIINQSEQEFYSGDYKKKQ